nr:protein 5 [Varicosavirus lactucae]
MAERCFEAAMTYMIPNKQSVEVFEGLLGILDPVLTSKHVRRVYQEITVSFLMISLISDQVDSKGIVRMSDSQGDDNDSLSSLTWNSKNKLWGFLINPVPITSGDLEKRMRISCMISSDAYRIGTNVAQVRFLLRIGTFPLVLSRELGFLCPSSSRFPSVIFVSPDKQTEMLRIISSYYSVGDTEEKNCWGILGERYLTTISEDISNLVFMAFPFLQGAFHCSSVYYLNFGCKMAAEGFHAMAQEELRIALRSPVLWSDCPLKRVYDSLLQRIPTGVHTSHSEEKGDPTFFPLAEYCSSHRECWICGDLKLGVDRGIGTDFRHLSERRTSSPDGLDAVMSAVSRMIYHHWSIPSWVSGAFKIAKFIGTH